MRDQNDHGTLDLITGRMMLGYARVSTDDQDLTNQRAELHAAGCSRLFAEKITGTRRDRPELARMGDGLEGGASPARRGARGLSAARKEIAKERAEMLAEIGRMDTEMETARESIRKGSGALEEERRAHEQTRSEAREARAIAEERLETNKRQDRELQVLRNQVEKLRIEAATLTERAAHADELRTVLKTLQAQQGRGEGAGKTRSAPKRRSKPEGSE